MPRRKNKLLVNQQNTAVLYARVSTRDQEIYGHSLEAQQKKLKEYADKHGFKVVKIFAFQETAGQKRQRKKFEEMLDYLRQHDVETMPVLLCNYVDRVTRNFADAVEIDDLRIRQGLCVHFVMDNLIITPTSTGRELFGWEGQVFMAKQYINNLVDYARNSHKHKLDNGEWPHTAPLGYLNTKDEQGRSTVTLDPDRAALVKRIFVEYAKGIYSVKALARMVNGWGLRNKTKKGGKISASQVHHILANPFYYGEMLAQDTLYRHVYSHVIDKPTWDKCQQVSKSYHKKPFAYAAKPFTFRGLITCAHCGSVYTSEIKKEKYTYLFCTKNKDKNCPAPRMKEEAVFAQVAEVLDRVAMPENVLVEVKKHLAESHKAKNDFHNTAFKALQGQLVQVKKKQQRIWDLYLNAAENTHSSITPDELDKMLSGFKQEEADIEGQLLAHKNGDADYYISLNLLLELVQNAGKLFHSASIEQKRKILKLVYWNLELEHGKLKYALRKPFDLFLEQAKSENWLGRQDSNLRIPLPKSGALPLGHSPTNCLVGTI